MMRESELFEKCFPLERCFEATVTNLLEVFFQSFCCRLLLIVAGKLISLLDYVIKFLSHV